jgi:hypothetical protein
MDLGTIENQIYGTTEPPFKKGKFDSKSASNVTEAAAHGGGDSYGDGSALSAIDIFGFSPQPTTVTSYPDKVEDAM